ncbi:MAG TPA: carbon-nitrogen hydrolase family protein, partial [Candidatus Acidoferrales bacterium]|nr:carbon-nitrogen hydrolase family protein [Candidatus Acidoferrales bacterium]
SIRVAALQLRAHEREGFATALDGIAAAVEEASAGAELVVLPEATFPAYVLGDSSIDDAAVERAVARLRELARRTATAIVVGAAVRSGPALRNAALVIDRNGSVAGRADKLFLWHFDRRWFEAGDRLEPIDTSVGRLGVLICADGRIPTIARALVDRGAEMLVMPTAWVTSGRDPAHLENVQADLLARVRAFENGVPFVAANKCGAELGMVAYCGKSQIVGASGTPLAMAGELEPETLRATVETGLGRPHRTQPALPPERRAPSLAAFRIAVSCRDLPSDVDRRLELLDDAFALAPGEHGRLHALDRVFPAAAVADGDVLDPAGLVGYRRAGYRLIVWQTSLDVELAQRLARARALELRVYAVVFVRAADRAFAVDPDGTIVAGTFGGFTLASFLLDPRKAAETSVAPSTDVVEGLARAAAIAVTGDAIRA